MAAKRCSSTFRRHSDTDVTDCVNRIPPLHGLASEDGDDIEDDWFVKLTNGNEPWATKVPSGISTTNYGMGVESIPLLLGDEFDLKERTLKTLKLGIRKIWKRGSATITETDTTNKVAYLGNVLTGWAKGEGCIEKPLNTLWKNYSNSSKPDVLMKLTVTQSGLKAVTKDHGLTEYWSHRITYCAAPSTQPRVFCWVYRHEGRKLKQELRCHAVLCTKDTIARRMATTLRLRLTQALLEFKRDKLLRQNARLSLVNSVYENPSLPRRKILLSTGSQNYRPPLERSKSAPKLMSIEESLEEEESTPKTKRKLSDPDDKMAAIPETTEDEEEKIGLNFYKKLCSSIENLVETTSNYGRRLRRASKDLTLKETLLRKTEQGNPQRRIESEANEEEEDEDMEDKEEEEVEKKKKIQRKTRKSVTFEDEEHKEEEKIDKEDGGDKPDETPEKPEEEEKKTVDPADDWSDEGASSLQSMSSTSSDETSPADYVRELHIFRTSMDRLHSYLDLFLAEDGSSTVIHGGETDSLSEEEGAAPEEDVVSDESGYVELAETSVRRLSLDSKEKDVPFHQIVKTCVLKPRPIESSCLHV